ncbi:MAG: hypothetical protein EOL87_13415 [Spartobacteria bacterium]|nr:hypothetical protein [Spartobacteria bacterium]
MTAVADDSSRITVRAGAVYRNDMKISASGGYHTTEQDVDRAVTSIRRLPATRSVTSGTQPSDASLVGPSDAGDVGDRVFDDGYNKISPPTAATTEKDTWNWGYSDKANQYDSGRQQINYHRTTSQQAAGTFEQYTETAVAQFNTAMPISEMSESQRFDALGLTVEASMAIHESQTTRMSIDGGIVAAWSRDISLSETRLAAAVEEKDYIDRVDAGTSYDWTIDRTYTESYAYDDMHGVIGSMAQSYAGSYGGPGPLLGNRPASYNVATNDVLSIVPYSSSGRSYTGSQYWQAETTVDLDVDMMRETVWMGSTFEWLISSRVNLFVTPKVSVNVVDMTAKRKETLTIIAPDGTRQEANVWRDEEEQTYWLPGMAVSAGMGYGVSDNLNIQLALAREWVFEHPDMDVGPSRVEADLDSYNVEVSVGYAF